MIGSRAKEFSYTWRGKQLEYSFRRGLMRQYRDFTVCTRQALDYTCAHCKTELSEDQKGQLLESYRTLPAFADVKEGLANLKAAGFRMFAFSNGRADAVETLLSTAGIQDFFTDIVSVSDKKTFKPDPAAYGYFLERAGTSADNAWLISSNPFDIIGAVSAGMSGGWIRRSNEVIFDPWEIDPTATVENLCELSEAIIKTIDA